MKTAIVIPARLQSTRLPNKPLLEKQGKPLIQHVWEKCMMTGFEVFVATDDEKIKHKVDDFGGQTIMTDPKAPSGTDRCAQAMAETSFDRIINVQGDMPYIDPTQITQCADILESGADVGTLIYSMEESELTNPNSVKCIATPKGNLFDCRWFGRMAVSYGFHHAGIYAYTKKALDQYANWPEGQYEKIEKLEQLRWLENSYKILASKTDPIQGEINTPEDYDSWIA